jgi:organic hydroperoxide reductase OsmC/OhrA
VLSGARVDEREDAMKPFPHVYRVTASASEEGAVTVRARGLPPIDTHLPVEFGGTGERWSPEELFAAAIADCFVLTFRGVAKVTGTPWTSIVCDVDATLERIERQARFTLVTITARVRVPKAEFKRSITNVLERAQTTCLVTNSLNAEITLDIQIEVGENKREYVHVA